LAIDTSTQTLTVAVLRDSSEVASISLFNQKTHSERLMTAIDDLLAASQLDIRDIDLFAAANGPGSYTGIRIGLAAVKMFAQVTDKPVVTVNTLLALCYNLAHRQGEVCALLDARGGNVYCGCYSFKDGVDTLIEPVFVNAGELKKILKDKNITPVFVGDMIEGFDNYADGDLCLPSAVSLGKYAFLRGDRLKYNEVYAEYVNKNWGEN